MLRYTSEIKKKKNKATRASESVSIAEWIPLMRVMNLHENLVHLTGRRLDGLIVTTMTRSLLDSESEGMAPWCAMVRGRSDHRPGPEA